MSHGKLSMKEHPKFFPRTFNSMKQEGICKSNNLTIRVNLSFCVFIIFMIFFEHQKQMAILGIGK